MHKRGLYKKKGATGQTGQEGKERPPKTGDKVEEPNGRAKAEAPKEEAGKSQSRSTKEDASRYERATGRKKGQVEIEKIDQSRTGATGNGRRPAMRGSNYSSNALQKEPKLCICAEKFENFFLRYKLRFFLLKKFWCRKCTNAQNPPNKR